MKTIKFKLLIPVVAIVFAVTSAFTTSASSKVDAVTAINGYIDHETPCEMAVACSLAPGPVCTNGNDPFAPQVYGKWNPSDTTCPREVYLPQ
ncbi:DUF6520 family protein [Pseudotamlana agarivorans]|uniref:DUF6520 family protein n=1 Tax=Pseudotamlana agarivorans TaxID=481183 RepID=UPI0008311E10|nr:DUF6520 family protein [Tamlana agarivorans]